MTGEAGTGDGPCQCAPCIVRARKRRIRAWRWITGLDLTKPPAPVLRWLGILLIGIVYAAAGAPRRLSEWLWAAILAGALILPDVAGFGIGGMRLDLKHAREELATLRQEVNAQARATSSASVGPVTITVPGLGAYGEVTGAERDRQQPYVPRRLDTGTPTKVTSEP